MRIVGLIICLALVGGALWIIGPALYLDINSLLIVVGGGIGYALLKGGREPFIKLFGDGAVYFSWIGSLIGLIAITGGRFDTLGILKRWALRQRWLCSPFFMAIWRAWSP
jgi:hypothetical protein